MTRARLSLPTALASITCAAQALAQPSIDNEAKAQALFKEALVALDRGDYAAACPKFAAAGTLFPSASAQLNIARCFEHDGKVASAWAAYQRTLVLNRATREQERRDKLEKMAADGAAALEPKLPRVRIVVRGAPAGLRVEEDGQELPAATFGTPMPTDPGPHRIAASAAGYKPFDVTVTFEIGKMTDVPVKLQPAPDAPKGAGKPGGVPVWAWISGAVGVAALGVGTGFGIDAQRAQSTLTAACKPDLAHCTNTTVSARDADASLANERDRNRRVAIGLGVVGAAGIVAGAVGIALKPSSMKAPQDAMLVVPFASPLGAGLAARGSF